MSNVSVDMASGSEAHASAYVDSSSDDECLLAVKRKAEIAGENEKKGRYDEDSDGEPIMAGVLVTVEVEEIDEDPLDFNKVGNSHHIKTPWLQV